MRLALRTLLASKELRTAFVVAQSHCCAREISVAKGVSQEVLEWGGELSFWHDARVGTGNKRNGVNIGNQITLNV